MQRHAALFGAQLPVSLLFGHELSCKVPFHQPWSHLLFMSVWFVRLLDPALKISPVVLHFPLFSRQSKSVTLTPVEEE